MQILEALRSAGIDVADDALTRVTYAHDASNYRIRPMAVAFPRNPDEVSAIVRACVAANVPLTARGAGTGIAGNSIGAGVVVDFRRHMHRIDALDVESRTVRVQPGAVLDDVQLAAAPAGLMFGPDPSTHSRATIGGMLGNDACGNHSVAYGRTSHHVTELELVLADGTRAIATRNGLQARNSVDAERVSTLTTALQEIATAHVHAIRSEFARSERQVSGYAADALFDGFDIARLLVGSEGTLALVVGATLQLVDVPNTKQLLVVGYADLVDAARDLPLLLQHRPSAIEALDAALVSTMRLRRGPDAVPELPEGSAWLFIEFADTVASADMPRLVAELRESRRALALHEVTEPGERTALWRVREDGAGLASTLADGSRGKPGWEDAAVPAVHLAEYLQELRTLSAQHGFTGVLYGHFGAGCVHVRYDFDVATETGRDAMRAFLLEAAQLVARFGGSISGEHGDGRARGELLQHMYSQQALECFRRIKEAFDPMHALNPGIIINPPLMTSDMPSQQPSVPTMLRLGSDGHDLGLAAARCTGVARCVTATITDMCPTYQVTLREQDGTRGRARAIQAMFEDSGDTTEPALEALDTCLACRACATDCPSGVDMATYKAEVLHRHYQGRRRPITHYTLGWLPRLSAAIAPVAPLVNAITASPVGRVAARAAGITSRRPIPRFASSRSVRKLQRTPVDPQALLFIDSTTRSLRPQVADAALQVLAAAGVRVSTLTEGCCGLTYLSTGQLETARRTQHQLLDLMEGQPVGIPVIVLEPSCAATLSHDLPALIDDARAQDLSTRIRTFAHALTELAPDWKWPQLPGRVVLQTHCHERAVLRDLPQERLLNGLGVQVTSAVGCCGMAGAFGYEDPHYDLSVAVAKRSLLPAIDHAPDVTVLADGFGCACQVEQLRPGVRAWHLAEVLAQALALNAS